jgi:hypothetical protein
MYTITTRSAFGTGSGRSSTASIRLKTAVLPPMPIASVRIAASVNPGLFASVRTA